MRHTWHDETKNGFAVIDVEFSSTGWYDPGYGSRGPEREETIRVRRASIRGVELSEDAVEVLRPYLEEQ